MPFLYIYSPSDFTTGLPDERGAQAAGRPNFTLTLTADAQPTLVEISDDDAVFDEVDGSQVVTNDVTIDGVFIAAGTSIHSAYDLLNSTNGHQVTSLHFGGDGYQQGAVDGIATTEPLVPGQSYTFDRERTSHRQDNQYTDFVACFTAGTLIDTPSGAIAIETLRAGDMVTTLDHGPKPVRRVLSRKVTASEFLTHPNLLPVRISSGALGQGKPIDDLTVSPQHRFLTRSNIAARMFGAPEALLAARKLTVLPGIDVVSVPFDVTYYHLVMDQHEIVSAHGAPAETFFCGPNAINGLDDDARAEMLTLFPEVFSEAFEPSQARFIPRGKQQAQLVRRHERNRKPILDEPIDAV